MLFRDYLFEGEYNLCVTTYLNDESLHVQVFSDNSLLVNSVIEESTIIPLIVSSSENKVLANPSDCYPYEIYLTLQFSMNAFYLNCSFSLNNKNGQVLLSSETTPFQSGMNVYTICVNPTDYTLTFLSNSTGWHGQYADIFADNMLLSRETLYFNETSRVIPINVNYSVFPRFSAWYYSLSGEPPTNWKTDSSSTSMWAFTQPGMFPSFTSVTQYYVTSFKIQSSSPYSFLRLSCVVYAGAVVYLNGHEIGRVNMPKGEITHDLHASKSMASPTTVTFTVNIAESFVLLKNVVAIELHSYDSYETTPSFDASVLFIPKQMELNILYGGYPTVQPYSPTSISTTLTDLNPDTQLLVKSNCSDIVLSWNYNNDFMIINHYSFTPNPSCTGNAPSGWIFEGSNDGAVWTILDVRNNIQFTSSSPKDFQFYNMKAFQKYRFRITSCDYLSYKTCHGMALSDLRFSMVSLTPHCIDPYGYYQPSLIYEYSYLSCPQYSTGYTSMYCSGRGFEDFQDLCIPLQPGHILYPTSEILFHVNEEVEPIVPLIEAWLFTATIYPYLPKGLTMDPSTGIISGKPAALSSLQEYSITVTNSAGSKSVVLFIEVGHANTPLTFLFIGVEIVLLCLIVCIFVYVSRVVRSRKRLQLRNLQNVYFCLFHNTCIKTKTSHSIILYKSLSL